MMHQYGPELLVCCCGALALLLLLLLLLQFTTHRVGVEQNHPVALLPASHRCK